MIRYATAAWVGPGMTGEGRLTLESSLFAELPFSFDSRFGTEMKGTNPEELLAAAHASCFTMKLSFVLEEAGYAPKSLLTNAYISFVNGAITGSKLEVYAHIPGISELVFRENVAEANRCCPVSRALSIAVTFDLILESSYL